MKFALHTVPPSLFFFFFFFEAFPFSGVGLFPAYKCHELISDILMDKNDVAWF